MTGALVLWLAVWAGQVEDGAATEAAQATQAAVTSFRTGRSLREATRSALQRWAKPATEENESAARAFLRLYQELQADRQLPVAERERLRSKVRNRLQRLSSEIAYQAAVAEHRARNARPKQMALPGAGAGDLAQLGNPGPGLRGPAVGQAGVGARGGTSLQGMPDAGQDLVALIQRVIAPQSWDVAGGQGSISYWAPGYSIVVRQTAEVHEQLGDAIQQLRRAGQ